MKKIFVKGATFGSITIIDILDAKRAKILCLCGIERVISIQNFRRSSPCGCINSPVKKKIYSRHNYTGSSEYRCWLAIKKRCNNTRSKDYKNYGGRGISVCREWMDSFHAFINDMGNKPSPEMSLDRINVNGNYEPSNCRWANDFTQQRNTRKNIFIDVGGERVLLLKLAEITGLDYNCLYARVKMGWSAEKILSKPSRAKRAGTRKLHEVEFGGYRDKSDKENLAGSLSRLASQRLLAIESGDEVTAALIERIIRLLEKK